MKASLFLLLFIVSHSVYCQNLLPEGSFEFTAARKPSQVIVSGEKFLYFPVDDKMEWKCVRPGYYLYSDSSTKFKCTGGSNCYLLLTYNSTKRDKLIYNNTSKIYIDLAQPTDSGFHYRIDADVFIYGNNDKLIFAFDTMFSYNQIQNVKLDLKKFDKRKWIHVTLNFTANFRHNFLFVGEIHGSQDYEFMRRRLKKKSKNSYVILDNIEIHKLL